MPLFRKNQAQSAESLLRPHFDAHFYLTQNPELARSQVDPVQHYLAQGAREGRDPAPWFSTFGYLAAYPDVVASGMNPLLHYLRHGRHEGRALPWLAGERDFPPPRYVPEPALGPVAQVMRYLHHIHGDGDPTLAPGDILSSAKARIARHIEEGVPLLPQGDGLALYLHKEAVRPLFDAPGFARHNPDVAATRTDLLAYYCETGWRQLDNPAAGFDVRWYWRSHLNPAAAVIDPLLHYVLVGEDAGLATRHGSPVAVNSADVRFSPDQQVRRACMFAGHDPHGRIDDHVVHYLRQLSCLADVYYLADGTMLPGELEKLDGIAKGAWSLGHERGAPGSHAMLLGELVGWDQAGQYDEVILASDRAFLIGELEPVFARMDALSADWWGLHASKGQHKTRRADRERLPVPILLEDVRSDDLQRFEDEFDYSFAVSSDFAAFRQPVLRNPAFRDHVRSWGRQGSSDRICSKHAIGLTQFLIQQGHSFECFVDRLYPLPPTVSEYAFDLLAQGYPLLSCALLTDNPYYMPELDRWQERLLAAAPHADVRTIEAHLERVCDPEKLALTLHTGRDEDFNPLLPNLYSAEEMAARDLSVPKRDDWWVFPACAYDRNLSGNERAVFEAVRHDPAIRKIVLTRGRAVDVDGANVHIYPLMSREGQDALLQSRVIFIKHSPSVNLVFPLAADRHLFIGLWHGIPFKRIGTASLDTIEQRAALMEEHAKLTCVIASSPVDRLAMTAGFQPLGFDDVWLTGLPRTDFILRSFEDLPEDFRARADGLRAKLEGKRLVLFCPTFRSNPDMPGYRFSSEEIEKLDAWLGANNAVLGIREHMADRRQTYSSQLKGENFLPLPATAYPDVEVLYRVSDCLVTDYSSCFIDYMLTGKAAISFAYDLEDYRDHERGTFYELETVFPGQICRTAMELVDALDAAAGRDFANDDRDLEMKRRMFFSFTDDGNAQRVVSQVKRSLGGDDASAQRWR